MTTSGTQTGWAGWIDASAGIAGDMLLAALVDAGADLAPVQAAVDAVLPRSARLTRTQVTRAGQRATKIDVHVLVHDPPHRRWSDLRNLLQAAALPPSVRDDALRVFSRLADAEAHVHGVAAGHVHFHEVGAIDSIADIVGVCAAVHQLGITNLTGGTAALGSGRMHVAHGDLSIPGPAVTELARGWTVTAGGPGELATPTGMALLTALAARCQDLPAMTIEAVGVGAGTRDTPGRPNTTRILIGTPADQAFSEHQATPQDAVLLEANIDDLDPRIWPSVLAALLEASAAEAWLVPIIMKKGRPAHTLTVLADPQHADTLRTVMFTHTTTFGVRQTQARKYPLPRGWVDVILHGRTIPIKIAHNGATITRATPEFDDIAALAAHVGQPTQTILDQARNTATNGGIHPGATLPDSFRTRNDRENSLADGRSNNP